MHYRGLLLIVVLAIAALGLSVAAILKPPPEEGAYVSHPVPTSAKPIPVETRVSMASALERLNDSTRPFTFVVLGDSTGADDGSWPFQVSEWISSRFDRPVTFYSWSEGTEPAGYRSPPRDLGSGTKAGVIVYNASAPSRNAEYSLTELERMIPVDMTSVDMVLVNHGHNHGPDLLVPQVHPLASEISEKAPQASLVFILQNPEIEGSPHAAIQATNTEALRLYAERFGYDTIDARRSYLNYGDFAGLYKDNVHPAGAEGYRIWAEEIIAAFSGRG